MYTMADYKTKARNLYLNISGQPLQRLQLQGSVVFSTSTAAYQRVTMPDVSSRLDGALSHQDFTFDEMPSYSNLEYSLVQTSIGLKYLLGSGVTYSLGGEYADLSDDAGYVYGIESGSLFMIRSGFAVDF